MEVHRQILQGLETKQVYTKEIIFSPEGITSVFQGHSYIHCINIF